MLQAVRGKPMSKDEVELLYRVFDTNKDGFLELSGRAGGAPGRSVAGGTFKFLCFLLCRICLECWVGL